MKKDPLYKLFKDSESTGKYRAFNDKKVIGLLAGDTLPLDYPEYKASRKEVKLKLKEEENGWIKEATPFLAYTSSLQKLKIN